MDARLPDAFLKSVVELLPTQGPPGPQGGRPELDAVLSAPLSS